MSYAVYCVHNILSCNVCPTAICYASCLPSTKVGRFLNAVFLFAFGIVQKLPRFYGSTLLGQLVIFLYVILSCLTFYCSKNFSHFSYVSLYSTVCVYRSLHLCMGGIFLFLYLPPYLSVCRCSVSTMLGPGSSVGIATGYGLDGPGVESR